MEQSEQINELAAALSKAQGQITGALKDTSNDFYKRKYADLASCWDSCRKPLADNGLAVIQTTAEKDGHVYVVTTLAHSSGQWMRGWLPVKVKDDGPQAQGSGLTYSRRYALAGIVGLAQIDDDAESAQGRRVNPADHGERLTSRQESYAKEFASKIKATLYADKDEAEIAADCLALHAELNEDQLVYIAATGLIEAKDRAAFKKYIQMARKAAA
jgi:hypothetical protein